MHPLFINGAFMFAVVFTGTMNYFSIFKISTLRTRELVSSDGKMFVSLLGYVLQYGLDRLG